MGNRTSFGNEIHFLAAPWRLPHSGRIEPASSAKMPYAKASLQEMRVSWIRPLGAATAVDVLNPVVMSYGTFIEGQKLMHASHSHKYSVTAPSAQCNDGCVAMAVLRVTMTYAWGAARFAYYLRVFDKSTQPTYHERRRLET